MIPRFQFEFEALLRLRSRERDQAQLELAEMRQAERHLVEQIEALVAKLKDSRYLGVLATNSAATPTGHSQVIEAHTILEYEAFRQGIGRQIDDLRNRLSAATFELESLREQLLQAERKVQTLLELKLHHKRVWQQMVSQKEQTQLDEIAALRRKFAS